MNAREARAEAKSKYATLVKHGTEVVLTNLAKYIKDASARGDMKLIVAEHNVTEYTQKSAEVVACLNVYHYDLKEVYRYFRKRGFKITFYKRSNLDRGFIVLW